jgi:uncharacterized membrane protein (DUF373 family)
MVDLHEDELHPVRARVVGALTLVEDVIYSGLGLLLAVYAIALLVRGFHGFLQLAEGHADATQIVDLLDQVLMILLVVELLYTVQVSFRTHGLVTEPFLVVGLISVIRRVLVLTAQLPQIAMGDEASFRHAAVELGMLTLMIVVLVGALIFMQRQTRSMTQEPADGVPADCPALHGMERGENSH